MSLSVAIVQAVMPFLGLSITICAQSVEPGDPQIATKS